MSRCARTSMKPRNATTKTIVPTSAQSRGQSCCTWKNAKVTGLVSTATKVAARVRRRHSRCSASCSASRLRPYRCLSPVDMVIRVLRRNLLSGSRDGRSERARPPGDIRPSPVARARGSRYGARPVPKPMRRLPRVLPTAALAITLMALGALAPTAGAQAPRLTRCPGQAAFGCDTITVPLDYSGQVPGTIALRFAARRTFPRTGKVIFALTGGPGQQGIDFATPSSMSLAPALRQYRLVVLDQRGTGKSGVLRCPSLQSARALDVVAPAELAACAARIGPRRQFYTSADTVLDLESLRKALGATKVALMGISYGTHVALQYARAFPQNVDRLVLDSIVGPDGPDSFLLDTYRTLPRI